MVMKDDFIVTIAPGKIEVHKLDELEAQIQKIDHVDLPNPVGYVAMTLLEPELLHNSPNPSPMTVRVCLTTDEFGLNIYDITLSDPTRHSNLDKHKIWSYLPPEFEDTSKPSFGHHSATISWFHAPQMNWKPISFETARLPLASHAVQGSLRPYALGTVDMPALYCMGVRDYDEARGIVVLGNAFGELSLYDLSGTDSRQLEECFEEVTFAPLHDEQVLSKVSVVVFVRRCKLISR